MTLPAFARRPRAGAGARRALWLLPWVAHAAWADVAPPTKDGHWRGTAGVAVSAASGNTRTAAVLLNTDVARATDDDKLSLGLSINEARGTDQSGVRAITADKSSAFVQYDRDFALRWFGLGRVAFDRDGLIQLTLRSSVSLGVGYRVIDTPTNSFTLQGGLGYTDERYRSPQTIANETATRFYRPSAYLAEESAHKLSATASFKQRLEARPSLDSSGGVTWRFNANIDVAINESLSLSIGLIDFYNTEPPQGSRNNDVSLFTGVIVKFGGP